MYASSSRASAHVLHCIACSLVVLSSRESLLHCITRVVTGSTMQDVLLLTLTLTACMHAFMSVAQVGALYLDHLMIQRKFQGALNHCMLTCCALYFIASQEWRPNRLERAAMCFSSL